MAVLFSTASRLEDYPMSDVLNFSFNTLTDNAQIRRAFFSIYNQRICHPALIATGFLYITCYLLQLLLDFGAQIECTSTTPQWTHPLHLATTYRYLNCFILLLEGGADITLAGHILHLICIRKYELLNRLLGNVTTLHQM
jgi:hypothetical protein